MTAYTELRKRSDDWQTIHRPAEWDVSKSTWWGNRYAMMSQRTRKSSSVGLLGLWCCWYIDVVVRQRWRSPQREEVRTNVGGMVVGPKRREGRNSGWTLDKRSVACAPVPLEPSSCLSYEWRDLAKQGPTAPRKAYLTHSMIADSNAPAVCVGDRDL